MIFWRLYKVVGTLRRAVRLFQGEKGAFMLWIAFTIKKNHRLVGFPNVCPRSMKFAQYDHGVLIIGLTAIVLLGKGGRDRTRYTVKAG